jgi:hypothetical protein
MGRLEGSGVRVLVDFLSMPLSWADRGSLIGLRDGEVDLMGAMMRFAGMGRREIVG